MALSKTKISVVSFTGKYYKVFQYFYFKMSFLICWNYLWNCVYTWH